MTGNRVEAAQVVRRLGQLGTRCHASVVAIAAASGVCVSQMRDVSPRHAGALGALSRSNGKGPPNVL
jgi:hypothetical protein